MRLLPPGERFLVYARAALSAIEQGRAAVTEARGTRGNVQ